MRAASKAQVFGRKKAYSVISNECMVETKAE
jgi:hypothetical protein